MGLTNKQQVFINEYLKCWNATEAAKRAGYSEKTAYSIGQENLKKPEISAVIETRLDEIQASADEVLVRLTDHARANIDDFLSFQQGLRLPVLDLAKAHENGKMHLIKKLKYGKDGSIEFELYDAQAAAVQLGRARGIFVDKQEIEHTGSIESKLVVLPSKDE